MPKIEDLARTTDRTVYNDLRLEAAQMTKELGRRVTVKEIATIAFQRILSDRRKLKSLLEVNRT